MRRGAVRTAQSVGTDLGRFNDLLERLPPDPVRLSEIIDGLAAVVRRVGGGYSGKRSMSVREKSSP
jgi:hypothetical protein